MARIESEIVASGIIGRYSCWKIIRLRDIKHDNECFELHINDLFHGSHFSVLEALKVLIDQFEE